jgi:GNAT superfamily N-acetyltransferase
MKEIITIQISKFLTNELVEQIAQNQWKALTPQFTNRSRQYIFDELVNSNDCFGVIATTSKNQVIGRIHCVKNESNPRLWYYGDLFVTPEYRRIGIAKQMVHTVINNLSEIGATKLRCYVKSNNIPSRNLQAVLGFSEKPFESFNDFANDGEIMYEIDIPSPLTIIPATINEAYFVRILFIQNRDALNDGNITLNEWKEILSVEDPDEKHFLICKGALPVAYMKINGLLNTDKAWLSMLFVAKDFQHQGIGSFALNYAEKYVKQLGFDVINVQTDKENITAINFYSKFGYQIYDQNSKIKLSKIL